MNRPIGLIGVGLMGSAIAERLVKQGFSLIGWDLRVEQRTGLAQLGGKVADDLQQVFTDCDFLVLSLPNDEVVRNLLDEHSSQLRSGHRIIDTSTGDPKTAMALAKSLQDRGIPYLDATISGSSNEVRNGTAVALVGATETALVDCQSILDAFTSEVLHVGPSGCGAQMKLVTNLVLGLNRAALAEGLVFAQTLGLPLKKALAVLKSTMAYSRIMDTKGNKMIARDFTPQAKLDQHAKDVKLMLASARESNLELPLSKTHLELLQRASQLGFGGADNSSIIEAYFASKQADESEA
ncbi:MAG: NAD(P)-dependent oxidoreductase [Planctomycetota bacterium]|nr:NAD(P)-dependent oxidoreductase [Planctomycetota bacterium]